MEWIELLLQIGICRILLIILALLLLLLNLARLLLLRSELLRCEKLGRHEMEARLLHSLSLISAFPQVALRFPTWEHQASLIVVELAVIRSACVNLIPYRVGSFVRSEVR